MIDYNNMKIFYGIALFLLSHLALADGSLPSVNQCGDIVHPNPGKQAQVHYNKECTKAFLVPTEAGTAAIREQMFTSSIELCDLFNRSKNSYQHILTKYNELIWATEDEELILQLEQEKQDELTLQSIMVENLKPIEGYIATLNFQTNYMTQLKQYEAHNPKYIWETIPHSSQIHFAGAASSGVVSSGIVGWNSGQWLEGQVEAVTGQVILNFDGACPLYQKNNPDNSLDKRPGAPDIFAYLAPTISYQYYLESEVEIKAAIQVHKFFRSYQKKKKSGFLFWVKTTLTETMEDFYDSHYRFNIIAGHQAFTLDEVIELNQKMYAILTGRIAQLDQPYSLPNGPADKDEVNPNLNPNYSHASLGDVLVGLNCDQKSQLFSGGISAAACMMSRLTARASTFFNQKATKRELIFDRNYEISEHKTYQHFLNRKKTAYFLPATAE